MISRAEVRYWAYSVVLWDFVLAGFASLSLLFVLSAWPKTLFCTLWAQWWTGSRVMDIVGFSLRWALEPGYYVYTLILSKNASDVCEVGVAYRNMYPLCAMPSVNEEQQLRLVQNAAIGSLVLLTIPISGLLAYLFICRTRPNEKRKAE